MICDLNPSKIFLSRLNEKSPDSTFQRNREKDLLIIFSQWNKLVFCGDLEWLSIVLNDGKKYGSIAVDQSTSIKDEYEAKPLKLKQEKRQWDNLFPSFFVFGIAELRISTVLKKITTKKYHDSMKAKLNERTIACKK